MDCQGHSPPTEESIFETMECWCARCHRIETTPLCVQRPVPAQCRQAVTPSYPERLDETILETNPFERIPLVEACHHSGQTLPTCGTTPHQGSYRSSLNSRPCSVSTNAIVCLQTLCLRYYRHWSNAAALARSTRQRAVGLLSQTVRDPHTLSPSLLCRLCVMTSTCS